MTRPPSDETRFRLSAAAKLLIDASVGNTVSVIDAAEAARDLIDKALDAETGMLEGQSEGGRA